MCKRKYYKNPTHKICGDSQCGCYMYNRDEEKRKNSIKKAVEEGRWGSKNPSALVKKSWVKFKKALKETSIMKKKDVLLLLNKSNNEYYGKSGNRKCSKDNISLYKTILILTKCLDVINKTTVKVKFSTRLTFLIKYKGKLSNIKCYRCKEKYAVYRCKEQDFSHIGGYMICKYCWRKITNTDEFFILKYGNEWEDEKKEYWKNISKRGNLGISGFTFRYGKEKGREKYLEYWKNIFKTRKVPYSKISQELFWNIYNNLNDLEKKYVYFEELNNEKRIFLSKEEQSQLYDKMFIFSDFTYKNKIIEYDGEYWHDKEVDKKRDVILKDKGYEVLRISSDDFKRGNINKKVIDKCVRFLNK
jgi:very-short-patch-repair endonuclease